MIGKNQEDRKMTTQELLLFRKWSMSEIEIKDPGLKTAISLKKIIIQILMDLINLKIIVSPKLIGLMKCQQ